MDEARAHRIAAELTGKRVGAWLVAGYLGAGKSAVVLDASNDGSFAALKVFDPDIVELYGEADQLQRIQRELELRGHSHPHLVQILDGGKCPDTNYLFIVMGRVAGTSLDKLVPHFPPSEIRKVISQLAGAAQFLEGRGLAHRDIKPSNIMLTEDFERATLLDFGVIRPIGSSDITDDSRNRPFIGTLRYAAPEFLERREEDTVVGWRAVTFYQLGGVLHDLIVRKPLFSDYEQPFTTLADAVRDVVPAINVSGVPADLQTLARNCLVKDWRVRESLVLWESFYEGPSKTGPSADRTKEQLRKLITLPGSSATATQTDPRTRIADLAAQLASVLRSECIHEGLLPPHELKSCGDGDGTMRFMLLFAASQRHKLHSRVSFHVSLRIEDPISESIAICSATALGREVIESKPAEMQPVYRGVLDFTAAVHAIEQALYAGISKAMNRPAAAAGQITWLKEDGDE